MGNWINAKKPEQLNKSQRILEDDHRVDNRGILNESLPYGKEQQEEERRQKEGVTVQKEVQSTDKVVEQKKNIQQIDQKEFSPLIESLQNRKSNPRDEPNLSVPLPQSLPSSDSCFPERSNRGESCCREEEAGSIYAELISSQIPGVLAKEVRKAERSRTLVCWLKQNPSHQNEKQRNSVLEKQGYQVIASSQFQSLREEYRVKMNDPSLLFLSIIVVFSFSERGNNDLALQQLCEFFLENKISKKLVVVKPNNRSQYNQWMEKIKSSQRILESPYPIQTLKTLLAQLESEDRGQNLNVVPLKYWPQQSVFGRFLQQQQHRLSLFQIRSKVALSVCLRVGKSVVNSAKNTAAFKRILYQYSIFHDLYFEGTSLSSPRQENYLKRFALKLLENPLQFYLTPSHQILIDRTLRFNSDQLPTLANVFMPIALVYQQIREQFQLMKQKVKYAPEFVCYSELELTEKQVEGFEERQIFQNTTFLKADLRSKEHSPSANVLLVIYVSSKQKKVEQETGFVFVEPLSEDIQPQEQKYFTGYKYVIFNLLNSFQILSLQYDQKQRKHRVELSYGQISRQIWLRDCQNYIPEEAQQKLRFTHALDLQEQLNFQTLLKYESSTDILAELQDFGDGYSLLQEFGLAIRYYQSLFKKNKSQMVENAALLSHLQRKKGYTYQMEFKFKWALEYYYNALNIITRGKNEQEQKQLHFGQQLQQIYVDSLRVLFKDKQYDKCIRLGESVIKNGKSKGGVQLHSSSFKIDIFRYLACSFFQATVVQYRIRAEESRIYHYFEQALQAVGVLGQFNPKVAEFYYHYGRVLLLQRKSYDGRVYISKGILIIKTIHTNQDPRLIPYLVMLAVAEYSIHEFEKARKSIKEAKQLVTKYFGEQTQKMGFVLDIAAKIGWRIKEISSVELFRQEISILKGISKRESTFKSTLCPSFSSEETDLLSMFARMEQIQGDLPFDSLFSSAFSKVPKIYECYLYLASLYRQTFSYDSAMVSLSEALKEIQQEEGEDCRLTIQIYRLMGELQLENGRGDAALRCGQKMWRSIVRNKKEFKQQSIRYYLYLGAVYDFLQNYVQASKEVKKARELAFKLLPSLPHLQLSFCRITDTLAHFNLKIDKLLEASKLFKESEDRRNALLKQITLRKDTIPLFHQDFEDYVQSVQEDRCLSIENQAEIYQFKGEFQQQIACLKKCHQELLECVGQYHCSTARLAQKIGQFQLEHRQSCGQALLYLNSALSIYSNWSVGEVSLGMIQTKILLAKIQQFQNQLGPCLQNLGKSLMLVRRSKRMGRKAIEILTNMFRITKMILEHKNLDYLRTAYFLLSDLLQEEKSSEKNLQETDKIKNQVSELSRNLIQLLPLLSESIRSESSTEVEGKVRRETSPGRNIDLGRIRALIQEGKKRRLPQEA